MNKDNALRILEISNPNPEATEVIKSFRRLSRKYHPDLFATASETVKEVMTEKFQNICEAKNFLLNLLDSEEPDTKEDFSLEHNLIEVEKLTNRRQFNEALNILNPLIQSYPNLGLLYEMRCTIYCNMENYNKGLNDLERLEEINPEFSNNPDYLHNKSLIAGGAKNFSKAHNTIDRAISLLPTPAPEFLATKARIFIMQGEPNMADSVIDRLKLVDPTHPLVRERQHVYNVGNTYVDKRDAQSGACLLCVILECVFDCI